MTEHLLVISSPEDDINTVHDFVARVWSEHEDLDAMDRLRFETALIELAANVIQHGANGGGIVAELTITVTNDLVRALITDHSESSHVDLSMQDMPDEYAESGRGIAFIQRLVDVFHYERQEDTNHWMIEKRRSDA